MSKIEAGRTEVTISGFDLHQLLHSIVAMLKIKADEKQLELTADYAVNLPRYVRTDESKLRQILINLLGNAIKFTVSGSVSLHVGYQIEEDVSRKTSLATGFLSPPYMYTLLFEIVDTGVGIAPAELETVFEPFVQSKQGHTQPGTGLGLPISRRFVEMMGGRMRVESEAGRGTTFSFTVQAAPASMPDDDTLETRQVIGLAAGQPRYRILLVEDNETNRDLLVQLLEPVGFEIREAENGRYAVTEAKNWQPHLVLMDLQMPEMDGLEATRRIKAQSPDTPIIALTAAAFMHDKEAAFAAGCDDFMTKPVDTAVLFHKISQHLDVQFVYDEQAAAPIPAAQLVLTPERLAGLSVDMRRKLNETAVIADRRALQTLITQIEETDPPLAAALAELVQNFQFERLVAVTE
jgi:CheY-like chemotaxis protein